jgi:hypothetical protein
MAAPRFVKPRPRVAHRPRRRFTVDEANRSLPLVSRIVRDIVATHRHAADTQAKLESAPNIKVAMELQAELESSVDRLQEYVDELARIGVELKDYEMGLIDFPGRCQSRDVLLCWHLGEEKVGHWHEVQAGYDGRQPIETLEPGA